MPRSAIRAAWRTFCGLVAYAARRMLLMEAEFRVPVATGEIMPRHKWSLASSRGDAAVTFAFAALMIFAAVIGLASTMHLHVS